MNRIVNFTAMMVMLPTLSFAQDLSSMHYMLEAMGTWKDCACSASALSYSKAQINQLQTQLNKAGMNKLYKFFDGNVDNTDVIEDYFGGKDHLYADNAELYALSSHGDAPTVSNQQLYTPALCHKMNSALCAPYSNQFVMGEWVTSPYGVHIGKLRWLILSTCYSVHTSPHQQWQLPFKYGLDMIMGYRGKTKDSSTTDEVLADFAEHAFRGNSKFKKVWFSATEDWLVNDTASIMTCHGQNTGTTEEHLEIRLNNYRKDWEKRLNNGIERTCMWSWHKG